MKTKKILGIELQNNTEKEVLEKILKYLQKPGNFFHIVSLNPENLVISNENAEFKEVVETSRIRINDGVGTVMAARILGYPIVGKVTGVDLMEATLEMVGEKSLKALLIGGKPDLAIKIANCYQKKYPQASFSGTEGIKNIQNPSKIEEDKLFSIVATTKPHFVFVSFGSPEQELWLWRNRDRFKGVVCMGVGGAFDFLAGSVPRAPNIMRKIGLEWFFRLLVQPWRWRRQLRLIKFVYLVIKEKMGFSV